MLKPNSPADLPARYRAIPSVQTLLQDSAFRGFPIAPRFLKPVILAEIEALREDIPKRARLTPEAIPDVLRERIRARLERLFARGPRRVINATGIILHTNLGRAPLPEAARRAIAAATEHFSNVEVDLASGRRGHRGDHVEDLLCLLTGAEAAVVTNNCAAGVLLALHTLSRGKEVPVSRGELVEIGGSFRMPDVMRTSGSRMVEIGTTNKTHLRDYAEAIGPRTGVLLKVHRSNFRIMGFTKSAALGELAELAATHDIPLVYDMGSGIVDDLEQWGYGGEPSARAVIAEGVDVVIFSGDKLLGGPQAGIIIGKKRYIERMKRNHLLRALRCDKLTYAALAAVLKLYLDPDTLVGKLPVATMLTTSRETLRERAETLRRQLPATIGEVAVADIPGQIGSGALPLTELPGAGLRITRDGRATERLARALRHGEPPVVGYVQDDALMLNLLTVREDELAELAALLTMAAGT